MLISTSMIYGAWMMGSRMTTEYPRFTLATWFAFIAGFSFLVFTASGRYEMLLQALSFDIPSAGYSEMAGNVRRWDRLNLPLSLGAFAAGFMATYVVFDGTNELSGRSNAG